MKANCTSRTPGKVNRQFTVTDGLRLSLEPPVYEANGQQSRPTFPLPTGCPNAPSSPIRACRKMAVHPISFIPSSKGRAMYPFHTNWAPVRPSPYSPRADSRNLPLAFRWTRQNSIRAGAGIYYDILGQPLAQAFNSTAFGLATTLTNPPNQLTSAQVPPLQAASMRFLRNRFSTPTASTLGQNYPNRLLPLPTALTTS